MNRVYYIFNVPTGTTRGFHAHKNLRQQCCVPAGHCDFILDDGRSRKTVHLNSPEKTLPIASKTWREMKNFSHDAVLVVFASAPYDENDYIRDYNEFLKDVSQ